MNPIGIAASAVVLLGLAMTLRSTNGRLMIAGVALTLLALPLAAGGSPEPLVLAFRTVALLIAVFLLDHAIRRTTTLLGPMRLGGTAELGLIAAAFVLGALLGAATPDPRIPAIPLGASVALTAAAGSLLAFGTDTLRLGAGAMLLIAAGTAVLPALGGDVDAGVQLAFSVAELATAGAVAWLALTGAAIRHDL
ncbi:MAG: hypothetical protein ACHQ02_06865, partial [Candidatus Limnocylindrales bacterium]